MPPLKDPQTTPDNTNAPPSAGGDTSTVGAGGVMINPDGSITTGTTAPGNPPTPSSTLNVPGSQAAPQSQTGTSMVAALAAGLQGLPASLVSQLTTFANGYLTSNPNADNNQIYLALQQTPEWQQFFAGNTALIKQGLQPLSPADYLSYVQTAQQVAKAAGLPDGFMSSAEIGQLIGGQVSVAEMTDRVNNAYLATKQLMDSNPEVTQALTQMYGITQGDLLAYTMDPTKGQAAMEQKLAAGVVSGAGMTTGFAPVSVNQAMQIVQNLTGPEASTGNIGISSTYKQALAGFQQIAPKLTLTEGGNVGGTVGPGTITQEQLVGSQFIGDAADVRAVQLATGTRQAGLSGGGGYAGGKRGEAGGAGYGVEEGNTSTQP